MIAFLRVEVSGPSPALFSHEREVTLRTGNRTYCALIDERSLRADLIQVRVVEKTNTSTLVELPFETINSGRRIHVATSDLITNIVPLRGVA